VVQHGNAEPAEESLPDFDRLAPQRREMLAVSEEVLQDFLPEPGLMHDLPVLTVKPENLVGLCETARNDPRLDFKMLLCLTCVDYEEYFELVYFLQSLTHEQTLVIKTTVGYGLDQPDPRVPSVTGVWRAADWYEREAHDLFGVAFDGHPSLTPLLLYEEFEGYPGRKEYPLYEYQEF
jgi:NADH-quinone oxidoreductase subunit C